MINSLKYQGKTNQNYFEVSYTPVRMRKFNETTDSSCWKGCTVRGDTHDTHPLSVGVQNCTSQYGN